MSHLTVSLVTSDPAHGKLNGDIASITFGSPFGDYVTVQVPSSMNATGRAAWFRQLAEQASDVAIRIERAAAVVA